MESNKLDETFDIAIVGGGPAGLYTAVGIIKDRISKSWGEAAKDGPVFCTNGHLVNSKYPIPKIVIIEKGNPIEKRVCPAMQNKTACVKCRTCSIMEGMAGAGAFSDGKFPITNDFGGNLWEKIGKDKAMELMRKVDEYNYSYFQRSLTDIHKWPKLYSSRESFFKKICTQHNLHLLDADIRHLGTDYGQIIYKQLINEISEYVTIITNADVVSIEPEHMLDSDFKGYYVIYKKGAFRACAKADKVVVAAGRSGSKWVKKVCEDLKIPTKSNRVDIGIRFECPDEIWNHITKELYESKITYRTKTYEDVVRTFCMNPSGAVVTENSDGGITVNGHSFEDEKLKTNNTNFALLVSKTFTEPFDDSSEYGEAIVKLSNMLGGGVIVQRYGDLIRGKRSTKSRISENTVRPTLNAEPGDLSLVLPKRILDDIMEMIEALDHLVPGMKNDDNLLYGVEIKQYDNIVDTNNTFENEKRPNLFFIGDSSGITHSLSQASAMGLAVAEVICSRLDIVIKN